MEYPIGLVRNTSIHCLTPLRQNPPTGAKNVDALSREGDRCSIRSIFKAKKTSTVYSVNANLDKRLFEFLLIDFLDSEYRLKRLYRLSWKKFQEVKSRDKIMNAWYVLLSKKKLEKTEIVYVKTPYLNVDIVESVCN